MMRKTGDAGKFSQGYFFIKRKVYEYNIVRFQFMQNTNYVIA